MASRQQRQRPLFRSTVLWPQPPLSSQRPALGTATSQPPSLTQVLWGSRPQPRSHSDTAMAFIRQKFPYLSNFPDHIVREMNYETIHQLNKSIAAQSDAHKKAEPNERVLHNFDRLQKSPTEVPAGRDDQNLVLHLARLLEGQSVLTSASGS
jgi:hypothetical protein